MPPHIKCTSDMEVFKMSMKINKRVVSDVLNTMYQKETLVVSK